MSEMDEELLNDDDSLPELNQEDEDALLQDDDILDLAPEEDFNETLDDSIEADKTSELKIKRHNKFLRERKESLDDRVDHTSNKPRKPIRIENNRCVTSSFRQQQNKRFNQKGMPGKRDSLLIHSNFSRPVKKSENCKPCVWTTTHNFQLHKPQVLVRPLMELTSHLNNINLSTTTSIPYGQEQSYHPSPLISELPIQVNPWTVQGPHIMSNNYNNNVQFMQEHNNYQPSPLYQTPQFSSANIPMYGQSVAGAAATTTAILQTKHQQLHNDDPYVVTGGFVHQQRNRKRFHQRATNNSNTYKKPNRFQNGHNNNSKYQNNITKRNKRFANKNNNNRFVRNLSLAATKVNGCNRVKIEKKIKLKVENIDEADDKTKELLEQIEEQKRKRKELLHWKEYRRAAVISAEPKQVLPNTNNNRVKLRRLARKPLSSVQQGRQHRQIDHFEQQRNSLVLTNANSKKRLKNFVKRQNFSSVARKYNAPIKIISNYDNTQRAVVATSFADSDNDVALDEQSISHFLAERKVIPKNDKLMPTRKVLITNISSNTSNKKIIQICKVFGDVQL